MRDFVITTDNNADLPNDYIQEHGLSILYLSYILDGVTYEGGHGLPEREFYAKMREGSMPTTSQVNPENAREEFTKLLNQNLNIIHIAFSSGLSGSYNSAKLAAEEISETHKEAKIVVIDSLCASLGQGLLVHKALELKKSGKSLSEVAEWLEANKLHICHNFTVDDLNHLYRGGRVSKTTAILGTMANIKPIMHVDQEGLLKPIDKVRGRKKSLTTLVDNMAKQVGDYQNDTVFISHGDCIEDVQFIQEQVRQRFGIDNFMINYVGPTIGAHSGPGTIALCFMGENR